MERMKIIFIVAGGLIVISLIAARNYISPKSCPENKGKEVIINMRALKNQWKWEPNPIEVECGSTVTLNIYNEDEYDHGFALDIFGINQRMSPLTTTTVTFKATKKGEFVFYCSVPCGEGHFDQKGILKVK